MTALPDLLIRKLPRRKVLARSVTLGVGGIVSSAVIAQSSRAARADLVDPPYPVDPDFRLRRLDTTWLWRKGCESDQWPHVALDGTAIVAGWGDGWGYERTVGEAKSAIGFTRFSGTVTAPTITDLWADRLSPSVRALSLKPQALLKVGKQIFVYTMGLVDDRDCTRLFAMPPDGSTFTSVSPNVIRKSVEGLQVVGTVHYKAGVIGDIIVLLAEHGGLQSADLYVNERKNPVVWAARVTPKSLGDSSLWEWFCGWDVAGAPIWSQAIVRDRVFTTSTGATVVPVFEDARGAGKHIMISQCPSLPGFVLAKTQNWLELGLFYGPTALGPWTTLYYGPFVPPGAAVGSRIFTAQLVVKWCNSGRLALMWSGAPQSTACSDPASGNYDAVHLTRFAVEHL